MNVYSGDTEFRTSVAAFNGAAKGLRAHWSAELDYRFVKTLAEHTVCNEQDGIVFKHKYADAEIIEDVSRDIANKKPIQAIVHDLAIKFPNKIEQHRSRECIELLMTLRNIIPEFNFQQINNKHINMWTRVIVPFRQAFDCGTLYKGKSMLHKDCKRFTKAIMEFIANASIKGVNNVDYNIFRKPGKGSKLLEQWITAMLHTHKLDMVKFLIACGARLAFTYLKSRPAETLNFNEQNYLRTAEHSPKEILVILKRYMDDIIRQENIDSSAELGVVCHQGMAQVCRQGMAQIWLRGITTNHTDTLIWVLPEPHHTTVSIKHQRMSIGSIRHNGHLCIPCSMSTILPVVPGSTQPFSSQGYQPMRHPMHPPNVAAYGAQRMHRNMPSFPSTADSIAQNKLLEGRRGSVQLAPVPANYTVETVSQRAADQSIVEEPQPNIMESTPQMRSAISHMSQETSSVNAKIQTKTVSAPVTPNLNMRTTLAARSASASNPSKTSRDVLAAKDAAESVDAQQNSVASTNEKSSKTSSEYHHPASIVSLLSR
ncbi:hypothetical protein EV183_004669 [Coemansia sp. RSA 2336]|nr:hypothetical protein EV183_004669 [Coemansia sp. RSA 2336]